MIWQGKQPYELWLYLFIPILVVIFNVVWVFMLFDYPRVVLILDTWNLIET